MRESRNPGPTLKPIPVQNTDCTTGGATLSVICLRKCTLLSPSVCRSGHSFAICKTCFSNVDVMTPRTGAGVKKILKKCTSLPRILIYCCIISSYICDPSLGGCDDGRFMRDCWPLI